MQVEFRDIEKLSKGIHMGFIDEIKSLGANDRTLEEKYYAEVLREIEAGKRRDGLWSRALSETDYDENKAKAKYIKLRVQSLKDEVAHSQKVIASSRARAANKSEKRNTVFDTKDDGTPNTALGFILFLLLSIAIFTVGAALDYLLPLSEKSKATLRFLTMLTAIGGGLYGRYLGAELTDKIKKRKK